MKQLKKQLLMLCMGLCLLFGTSIYVQAANPAKVVLQPNKTYRKYDITGDKKADTIKIKISGQTGDWYNSMAIYVNGKKIYSLSNKTFRYFNSAQEFAVLCTLKNGKPFLYLNAPMTNGDGPVNGLFQYRSGKLKTVVNFHSFLGTKFKYGYHTNGTLVKVKGNTIYTRQYLMSYSIAAMFANVNYTYSNGTLKRSSNTYSLDSSVTGRQFVANTSIPVYK